MIRSPIWSLVLSVSLVLGLTFASGAFAQSPAPVPASDVKAPEVKETTKPVEGDLKVGTTLENLQAAFNGESNARERYLAFAAKATEDKFLQAARLFRAAAKAEEVHAAHHAVVIEAMGAKPKADIQKPEVKSTLENLQAALKGEVYERDIMYPAFIKKAEEEKTTDAVTTFKNALAAEGQHAQLYTEASKNLDSWKEATAEFFVCPVCGETTTDKEQAVCPVCGTERKSFVTII